MNATSNTSTRETSNDLRHTIDINNSRANCRIKIRLNDECKNGHQDFSITANFWEVGKVRNDRNMTAGGCCHDDILSLRPDLKVFVNLHLCDYSGVPMYAVENGFYHLTNGFNNTKPNDPTFAAEFCSYYRITPKQFDVLSQSENKLRYAVNLERLGILEQWKQEADEAIKIIEEMTGKVFLVDSVKKQYTAPTAEQIAEEDAKVEIGYYKPEAIAERIAQKKAAEIAKKYADIEAERDKEIAKAIQEYEAKKAVLDAGLSLENFIFYNHTSTGCFNWKSYGERVTKQQLEQFKAQVNLPGVNWECE